MRQAVESCMQAQVRPLRVSVILLCRRVSKTTCKGPHMLNYKQEGKEVYRYPLWGHILCH